MICRHENADHLKPGDRFQRFGTYPRRHVAIEEVTCEQFRCVDCGAWLSLGQAKDDERTAVELRAAEIVSFGRDAASMWLANEMSDSERDGWEAHMRNWDHVRIEGAEWAGYLARCIVEHDKEQA